MAELNPSESATGKSAPRPSRDTVASKQTGPAGSLNPAQQGNLPDRIGRFQIRSLLGEGAFARVYLGVDPELEREVAIKVPKVDELTPEFREAFLRENRLAAIIQHPNICPVYEVGTDGGFPYIVMRVVPGTLAGLLKRLPTPMPPKSAVAVARKLALGLTAAHAQKVVHRDLKPANVLYDEANREVLIADFGLARLVDNASEASNGVPKGTPAYMSPEQARGRADQIGPLSDVYSLGIILYEMLTGRVPFVGSVWEVMRDHCETTPPLPSQVRFGIDTDLDVIVLRAIAKHPADRYASAKAFASALGDYLLQAERGGSVPLFAIPTVGAEAKPARPSKPGFGVTEEIFETETKPLPTKPVAAASQSGPKPAPKSAEAALQSGPKPAPKPVEAAFQSGPKPAPKPVPKPVTVTVDDEDEEEDEDKSEVTRTSKKRKKKRSGGKKSGVSPLVVGLGIALLLAVVVIAVVILKPKSKPPEQVQGSTPNTTTLVTPPVTGPTEAERLAAELKLKLQTEEDYKRGETFYSAKNYAKARELYEKASAQNHIEAQYKLGLLYHKGWGVLADEVKARELYEKAATAGVAAAQNNLGILYYEGRGGPVDYVKARAWYEKAAEQSHAPAQTNLGLLYENANANSNPDYLKARQWYLKAAGQNYATAQYRLGLIYEKGNGVLEDITTALDWYRKAAAQGHEPARKAVERLEKQP